MVSLYETCDVCEVKMLSSALLAIGFLLSPRAFMISGSGIGLAANWYIAIVALLFITHLATLPAIKLSDKSSNAGLLESFGYGLRFFTLVFFSCSILGIAGYAFNEVFLYWFPNFLFSFIIVACSFFTSLLSLKNIKRIQLTVVTAILLGITTLSIASLWAPSPKNAALPDFFLPYGTAPFSDGLFLMAPLLVGYELFATSSAKNKTSTKSYVLALGIAVFFLSIFAYAALCVSGTEKLADSTVPYMIGARKILGQTGRYIMGGIIILGSYAAFNTTLQFLKSPLITFMNSHSLTLIPNNELGRQVIATAIPVLTVSVLLLQGYAGEPITESYIAGGFALWFIYYGVNTVSAINHTGSFYINMLKTSGIVSCLYLAYATLQLPEHPFKGLFIAAFVSIIIVLLSIILRRRLLP